MSENKITTEEFLANTTDFIRTNWGKRGFTNLAPVQEKVFPILKDMRDAVIEAPTGSGKTFAYLAPILEQVDLKEKNVQAIILAPSRELVMQIMREIQIWSEGVEIKGAAFIGGANIKKQLEKLKTKPQIIVGTPGRMLELIKQKKLKMHKVKTIVLDEGDILAEQEHSATVEAIVNSALRDRQLVLCTATVSEPAFLFAKEIMNNPEMINVEEQTIEELSTQIQHLFVVCEKRDKVDTVRKIIRMNEAKALVFTNDVKKIDELESKLSYKSLLVEVLEGTSSKNQRQNSLQKFQKGDVDVLLATDIAARGLDIANLEYVIHFDVPFDAKQYIHRSGRTGRMGQKGTVISIVSPQEEGFLKKIREATGIEMTKMDLYKGSFVTPVEKREERKEELKEIKKQAKTEAKRRK